MVVVAVVAIFFSIIIIPNLRSVNKYLKWTGFYTEWNIYTHLQSFFRGIYLSFIIFNYFQKKHDFMVWKMAKSIPISLEIRSKMLNHWFFNFISASCIYAYTYINLYILLLEITAYGQQRCVANLSPSIFIRYCNDLAVSFYKYKQHKKCVFPFNQAENLKP